MSENAATPEEQQPKEDQEEKLERAAFECNTYQAARINKLLAGSRFKLDLFENVKKKLNSSSKSKKKKPKMTSKPPEYFAGGATGLSDSPNSHPGSFSSLNTGNNNFAGDGLGLSKQMSNLDSAQNDLENNFGRRTSRREKKPATKVDLGYEEPKPIKGVKLSGAAREIFRK